MSAKMANKLKMPKNRAEFEKYIELAFIAGCNHGYAVEHTANLVEQEKLGALHYLHKIPEEEYVKKMEELRG